MTNSMENPKSNTPVETEENILIDAKGNARTMQRFPDGTTGMYSQQEYQDVMENWDRNNSND